jgi:hypothetical protein
MRRSVVIAGFAAAALLLSAGAGAQVDKDIKIGVLGDESSLYADIGGPGSVVAAKMAVADFGGTLDGRKIEVVSADHQNKPDLGASIARQWFDRDGVDMITDLSTSSVALAVQEVARTKNKVILITTAASSDLTGKACAPTLVHWTYNTVALANGTGAAVVKAGGDSWFFITADYAFGHALQKDTTAIVEKNGGKVLGSVNVRLANANFLVLSAAGASLEGEDHRPRQRRPRHDQHDQAGGRVRHRQIRAEAGGAVDLHQRRAQPRARDRAGAGADRVVLLGPGRRDARLFQALLRRDPERADDGPGRGLQRGEALSRGGQGRQNARRPGRDRAT